MSRRLLITLFLLHSLFLFSVFAQSGDLPDKQKTPGDVLAVTKDDVCTPGYSKKVRNVPASVKKQVYASYGITSHAPREYGLIT